MQLKPLSNITVPSGFKAKPKETLPEPEPLYQVHNRCDYANWHLLPDPSMLQDHSELPNLVHSFTMLNKEIGSNLRTAFSNRVILVT
ncbi:MAG: hypothetical protein EOP45_17565, partial [Sphingobacteriaceae bacterium]